MGSPATTDQLAEEIGGLVPVSQDLVTSTIHSVVAARTVTGAIAVVGLLWAASAVFGTIRKGVNTAWGIRKTRPFLQERLIDFSLALGAGLLFLVSIFSTTALSVFREVTAVLPPETLPNKDFISNQLAQVVTPTLSLLTFLVLYWFLPNTHVHLRYVWPGAVAATIAFEVVKHLFVFYLTNYINYNIVYGPIGGLMALMTRLYLSATILLGGALIISKYSAYMEERSRTRRWSHSLGSA